jgi:cyclic pyranopterin phosphate synthase
MRQVDRLRLSVTDRCDLRCSYCMPEDGVAKLSRAGVLSLDEMTLVTSVLVRRFAIRRIRLTGGEPLVREGLGWLVGRIADLGVDDLAMTTNAQMLAVHARELRARGLDRVNVSLDTLDPVRFAELTGGGLLSRTLEGIEAAIEADLRPVKINTVVLKGINQDEIVEIARWGLSRGCEVRFLELMPVGVAGPPHGRLFVPAREVIEALSQAFSLEALEAEPGSTSRGYRAREGHGLEGRLGIISPETEPFCGTCGRLRLTTRGRLLSCLHEEEGVDLMPSLRPLTSTSLERIEEGIAEAIAHKPACRAGDRKSPMHAVGG